MTKLCRCFLRYTKGVWHHVALLYHMNPEPMESYGPYTTACICYFRQCLACTTPTPLLKMINCIETQFGVWLFAIVINGKVNVVAPSVLTSLNIDDVSVLGCSRSTDKIECRLQIAVNHLSHLATQYTTTNWALNVTKFLDNFLCYLP